MTATSDAFAGASAPLFQHAQPDASPSPRAWSRRVAIDVLGFIDVIGVVLGGLVPAVIYMTYGGMTLNFAALLQTCLLTALFVYLCLRHFGFYDINSIHDLPASPARIALALAIGLLAALGVGLPFAASQAHFWVWYATWAAVTSVWVLAHRTLARAALARMTRSGMFDARIAVYGTGRVAERLAEYLADPGRAIRFAGVFDERGDMERHESRPGSTAAAAIPVGSIDDLMTLGRSGQIDRIIIALPQSADGRTADLARRLSQLPVSLHVCTHMASDLVDAGPAYSVSNLGPIGLLDVKPKPLGDWGRHLKSIEDYMIAAIALVLLTPLIALIALAVKIDSPGPVLFRQRRHGLNRRVIEVLKFRSMTVQEDGAIVTQARAGDARVTRLGRFLRASSLDELPQLVNVLRGEMSLIGPRPHALVHDDHYGEMLEGYANRHQVKPGMTGWAQVNGFRGPTETPDKMRLRVDHDLYYIDHWSLWLDLRILVLTVLVGFRHKNAL